MRIESSITSVSWIPSEAIRGLPRLPFDLGVGQYDDPPPDVLGDLEALQAAGAFRFANRLDAWVEVVEGSSSTTARSRSYLGRHADGDRPRSHRLPTRGLPRLSMPEPEVGDGSVARSHERRAAGRACLHLATSTAKPFLQWRRPTVVDDAELTLDADGGRRARWSARARSHGTGSTTIGAS